MRGKSPIDGTSVTRYHFQLDDDLIYLTPPQVGIC